MTQSMINYFIYGMLLLGLTACAGNSLQKGVLSEAENDAVAQTENVQAAPLSSDLDDFDGFNTTVDDSSSYPDPLEPMNRVFFEFNDTFYYWVLKPVSNVYSNAVPYDIRLSIGNFLNNLGAPVRFFNNVLQGEFTKSWKVFSRFAINSTLGVYGFGDPASMEFGIDPQPADFGQTLGVWGVGEGVYLCWPIIGPSNVRDSVGFAVDTYSHPLTYLTDDPVVSSSMYAGKRLNVQSLHPDIYEELIKYSLDPYISMRQVYFDYRRSKVGGMDNDRSTENEL